MTQLCRPLSTGLFSLPPLPYSSLPSPIPLSPSPFSYFLSPPTPSPSPTPPPSPSPTLLLPSLRLLLSHISLSPSSSTLSFSGPLMEGLPIGHLLHIAAQKGHVFFHILHTLIQSQEHRLFPGHTPGSGHDGAMVLCSTSSCPSPHYSNDPLWMRFIGGIGRKVGPD